MRRLLVLCLSVAAFVACSSNQPTGSSQAGEAASAGKSDIYFEASGDVDVEVDEAQASLTKNQVGIVVLAVTTNTKSYRKLGDSYGARLFFSKTFDPKPGKYPVEFDYMDKTDILGGSFSVGAHTFSYDTKGEAEFLEFGDQVKVRFHFQTADKSEGEAGRRVVTVRGTAVCPRGDAIGERPAGNPAATRLRLSAPGPDLRNQAGRIKEVKEHSHA